MWGWIILGAFLFLMILGAVVSSKFKKTVVKYSAVPSKNNETAAQVAKRILEENNISGVNIIRGASHDFSDNYNPQTNTITLSKSVYDSTSIAAISIAAHEVGHVIQYSRQTKLIKVRTSLIKPVMITQQVGGAIMQIGFIFLLFAMATGGSLWFGMFLVAGLLVSSASFIFSLVTLPVEYDASKRAKANLVALGVIKNKEDEEYKGADKVLSAAAKTYVVGFLSSLTSLLFYILMIFLATKN